VVKNGGRFNLAPLCNIILYSKVRKKPEYASSVHWAGRLGSRVGKMGPHVPTSTESSALTIYLGDATVAGGKLKVTGTSHWLSPNYGGFNESGFTGLPAGRVLF